MVTVRNRSRITASEQSVINYRRPSHRQTEILPFGCYKQSAQSSVYVAQNNALESQLIGYEMTLSILVSLHGFCEFLYLKISIFVAPEL